PAAGRRHADDPRPEDHRARRTRGHRGCRPGAPPHPGRPGARRRRHRPGRGAPARPPPGRCRMRGLAVVLLVALPGIACVDRGVTPQRAATADTADQVMTGMTRGITRDGIRLTDVQAESAWVYNA